MDRLLYIVHKGRENYDRTLQKCSEATGLTKQEVDILLFLEQQHLESRACDIVRRRGLSKAYVSKALSSLLEKGLIKAEICDNDHRYQHIILMPSSNKVLAYMKKQKEKTLQRLTQGISKEDIEIFMKVVEQMALNIEKEGSDIHV